MNKAFIILVLLSIFFSEVGYFFYYTYGQHLAKQEIKQKLISSLEENSLQQIDYTVNKDRIEWEEEGKEFYYEGQMYDVIKISRRNGHTYLHCLNDKKETALKEKINHLARENSSKPSSEKNKHILKLKITAYLLSDLRNSILTPTVLRESFFTPDETCISYAAEKTGPPPKI